MWKLVTLLAFFATVSASVEEFNGEYTPVAMYPLLHKECFNLLVTLNSGVQCTCADGKKVEFLEVKRRIDGNTFDKGALKYPFLITDDTSNVNALANVKCTCGSEEFPDRIVAKRLNKDYFITYKTGIVYPDEPNGVLIYGRQVPSTAELTDFLNTVGEIAGRKGGILCSKD